MAAAAARRRGHVSALKNSGNGKLLRIYLVCTAASSDFGPGRWLRKRRSGKQIFPYSRAFIDPAARVRTMEPITILNAPGAGTTGAASPRRPAAGRRISSSTRLTHPLHRGGSRRSGCRCPDSSLARHGPDHPLNKSQSARFPDSVASCITSRRALRTSGMAPAVPSGWKSKIKSLAGSWRGQRGRPGPLGSPVRAKLTQ